MLNRGIKEFWQSVNSCHLPKLCLKLYIEACFLTHSVDVSKADIKPGVIKASRGFNDCCLQSGGAVSTFIAFVTGYAVSTVYKPFS